jgi:hypothetical protein
VDGTLNVRIDLSTGDWAIDDGFVWSDVPPVDHKQEEKQRDEDSDDELEEMVPNIVDIWHYFLA